MINNALNPFIVSALATGIVFLFIGYVRGRVTGKSGIVAAIETLLIGAIAAIVAYVTGSWLEGLV